MKGLRDFEVLFVFQKKEEKKMDLSTIGVKFGWAVEETAGTKPKAFTWIKRCSKIAGINAVSYTHLTLPTKA